MDRILCEHKPSENTKRNLKTMGCVNCGNIILLSNEEYHALFALGKFSFSYKKFPCTQPIINTMMSCCKIPHYYYSVFKSHGYTEVEDLEIKDGIVVEKQYGGK